MGDASGRDDPFEEDRTADAETHRGAFGEYGGESRGLIERTFRERIVLAGRGGRARMVAVRRSRHMRMCLVVRYKPAGGL